MDPTSPCPDEPSWRRLLRGEVEELEREALEAHLDDCEACRVRLELVAEWPTLVVASCASSDQSVSESFLGSAGLHGPPPGGGGLAAERTPELPGFDQFLEIGRGGMGIVYRARQIGLDRPVAIKVLSAAGRLAAGASSRAVREARALARLVHPNIVRVYDVGEAEGLPYIVMEWVEGGDLADRLAERPAPPREAAALVRTLALAVAAAHGRGVIHRDIKPRNILLDADGSPRLTDFGLARDLDCAERFTSSGLAVGTPGYMAPEVIDPSLGPVGPLSDVHALGATLYAMLTGRPPFHAASHGELLRQVVDREPVPPRRLDDAIPCDLDTICCKCLEKRPSRRYESADALAADLGRFLEGRPIKARRVGAIGSLTRRAMRHPAHAALGASVAFLMMAFAVGGVLVAREQSRLRAIAETNALQSRQALGVLARGLEASAAALRTMSNSSRPEIRSLFAHHLDDVAGIYERCIRDRSPAVGWSASEVRMCGFLAELRDLQGRGPEADRLRQQCVEAGVPLLAVDPADIDMRLLVIDSATRVAMAIGKQGDLKACVAGFERAYRMAEAIGPDDVNRSDVFYIRSMAAANLAMTYRWLERPADAAEIRDRALEFARKVRSRRPDDAVVAAMLIEHLTGSATARIDLGRPDEATSLLDEGDALLVALANAGSAYPARDAASLRSQSREVRDRLSERP